MPRSARFIFDNNKSQLKLIGNVKIEHYKFDIIFIKNLIGINLYYLKRMS